MKKLTGRRVWWAVGVLASSLLAGLTSTPAFSAWTVGTPIVTYYAGPGWNGIGQTGATGQQIDAGGWNLMAAGSVGQLAVAEMYGLRALWTGALDDATVSSIMGNSALYAYYVTDEPSATYVGTPPQYSWFTDVTVNGVVREGCASIVSRLKKLDSNHVAYINLYPTYASSAQLGAADYPTYLSEYMRIVKPDLLSYDHYQFMTYGDTPDYFKNLALISHTAKAARIPFMNIVQAASWDSSVRIPTGNQLRYLYNTSLAYGAQGISNYVYNAPGHTGGMANADGTTTALYDTAKTINPEFVAIAQQVQSMHHIGAYHVGDLPPGYGTIDGLPPTASPMRLPDDSPFTLSGISNTDYVVNAPVKGAVLGLFGPDDLLADATRTLVVNLNYSDSLTTTVTGPGGDLSVFDPVTGRWISQHSAWATLTLEPGGGKLVGLTSAVPEPSALVLLATGLIGLCCHTWRQILVSKGKMAP